MPDYRSPGVYVEELPSAVKPIAGVGTSTAAFIGVVPDTITVPRRNPKYDPTKTKTPERSISGGAPDDQPAAGGEPPRDPTPPPRPSPPSPPPRGGPRPSPAASPGQNPP